jgi:hypothetical protein
LVDAQVSKTCEAQHFMRVRFPPSAHSANINNLFILHLSKIITMPKQEKPSSKIIDTEKTKPMPMLPQMQANLSSILARAEADKQKSLHNPPVNPSPDYVPFDYDAFMTSTKEGYASAMLLAEDLDQVGGVPITNLPSEALAIIDEQRLVFQGTPRGSRLVAACDQLIQAIAYQEQYGSDNPTSRNLWQQVNQLIV